MATPNITQIFQYEPEHRVIICCLCHQVVLDGQLDKHLRRAAHQAEQHGRYRSSFRAYYQQFPQRIQQSTRITIPHQPIIPIQLLEAPRYPTYQCQYPGCHLVVETVIRIQQHCRGQHAWENSQTYGRPRKRAIHDPKPDQPWQVVHSQQFMPHGPRSQRFAVVIPTDGTPVPIQSTERPPWHEAEQAMKEAIIQRERQIEAAEETRIRAHEPCEVNPWVERMGWAVHLLEEDRKALRVLLDPPNPEKEPILAEIGQRFARIVMVAQRTITNACRR